MIWSMRIVPTIYSNKDTLDSLPERRAFDFYATDPIVCDRALSHLPDKKFNHILDAGAGTGVWGLAARNKWRMSHITGIELRDEGSPPFHPDKDDISIIDVPTTIKRNDGYYIYNRWFSGKSYLQVAGYNENIKPKEASTKDALPVIIKNDTDLVIGNPPYNLAEDFVIYSIENVLNDTGMICMLLQASFLWGERRFSRVNSKYPPKEVIVRKRVSFTGNGKTNGDDYAYYIWEKGYTGKPQISWDMRK